MNMSKKIVLGFALLFSVGIFSLGKLRFASGFFGGTYNQMARTLNRLPGMRLSVIETRGSRENIDLIRKGKADIGFAQLDVLITSSAEKPEIKKSVRIILPIYREEVHVLAKKELKKLADLKGKKVSIGPKGSGTEATSRTLLTKLGLYDSIQKDFSKSQKAVTKLEKGDLDAVILISGAPVKFLSAKGANVNFHLIPFSSSESRLFVRRGGAYSRVKIRANMYPWQKEKVSTLAVESALIGSASLSGSDVDAIIDKIINNQIELIMSHEKWTDLDVAFIKKTARRKKAYFHPAAVAKIKTLKDE